MHEMSPAERCHAVVRLHARRRLSGRNVHKRRRFRTGTPVRRAPVSILVNKRAGSLSSLSLVGLIDSVELSSQAELAEGAELTTQTCSVSLISSVN
jgi:hypothetical protein